MKTLASIAAVCVATTLCKPALADGLEDMVKAAMASAYIKHSSTSCNVAETVPENWPPGLVEECSYVQWDVVGGKKKKREAVAQLVMPDGGVIANWIRTACLRVDVSAAACHAKLVKTAQLNTGFQFVVAGNVLEDLDGNGRLENYSFRNGITTVISPGFNGSEADHSLDVQRQIMHASDAKIMRMRSGKARYWLTLPKEMANAHPDLNVPADVGLPQTARTWAGIVRDEFVAALASPKNRLLEAALCARAKDWFGKSCKPSLAELAPAKAASQKLLACDNDLMKSGQYSFQDAEGRAIAREDVSGFAAALLDKPQAADTASHELRMKVTLKSGSVRTFEVRTYCFGGAKAGPLSIDCPFECDGGRLAVTQPDPASYSLSFGEAPLSIASCEDDTITVKRETGTAVVLQANSSQGECVLN